MSHKTTIGFNNVITRPSVPYNQSEGQMAPKKFAAKNLSPRFTRSMKVSQGKRFLDKESYSPSSSTLHRGSRGSNVLPSVSLTEVGGGR